MRKLLLSLTVLAGATVAVSAANARPVVIDIPGFQLVQYHGYGGRYHEWRRHESRIHWRHEGWRYHHGYRHW